MAKTSEIEKRLKSFNRPMVNMIEIAHGLGLTYQGLYDRLRTYPKELVRPPTMKCGGADMAIVENAIEWCEKHAATWAAIQAAKRGDEA